MIKNDSVFDFGLEREAVFANLTMKTAPLIQVEF